MPFVVYRKPNIHIISGFFMNTKQLCFTNSFTENGFVFAPFDSNDAVILIPSNQSSYFKEKLNLELINHNTKEVFLDDDVSKLNHIRIVEEAIQTIDTSDLKKIVISRKEKVQLSSFNLITIYKKLLQNYNNAFVYVWFHPKIGLWLGATPETLLNINDLAFKTMSLAGTQLYTNTEKVTWQKKELEEQQLVTDFIKNQLETISSKLKIDKTETVKAGNLLHLRTKVEGMLSSNASLKLLIRALHPTPAVCGLPRDLAKSFILENENYNRKFYTGFLGEINLSNTDNLKKTSDLYVNLRCMEIENSVANIYVGGGITSDSESIKEWQETVSKSKTMKRVLF